ncbi:hypothetical protein GGX14DRAFT_492611 [Mycena pura]|uniref:Protein kinase domain-containing protein n=1 Tax=Mycena pura TaxID=153505 RepID=A0AAD6YKP8_9AGAR|nr:hypothetical protein GGX14DRAFT_492611 [Mycena pura]
MEDLAGEIVEAPAAAFIYHYLPALQHNAFEDTYKAIIQSDAVEDFRMNNPPSTGEDLYFKHLVELVDNICQIYSEKSNAKRTVKLACRPAKATVSEIEGGSSKSDGIWYLIESSVPSYALANSYHEWFSADVVANVEFNLLDKVKQKRKQAVGGVTHYMANDPRRTHMYSLTVEKDHVHLWYYCRSHCVKSEAFGLCRDIKSFIHFTIAISFGTEEELGFDPTIKRMRNSENKIYYEYTLGDTAYKTLSAISEHATTIPGRGTRVWRVEKPDGTVCVLKDYWIDAQDKDGEPVTEGLTMGKLYERLDRLKERVASGDEAALVMVPEAEREDVRNALQDYSSYFVNISSCQILGETKNIWPSYTRCGVVENEPVSREDPAQVEDGQESRVSAGQGQSSRPFLRKRHCRLVYREECTPFYAISNIEEVVHVLHDCVLALQLLFLAGFVHRDISPGNLLLYRNERGIVGKLSDFEYAKLFPRPREDEPAGDPKTGTPGFVAVEVIMHLYLHMRTRPRPPLRFNFLHDIESVLWITLYAFATRTLKNTLYPSDDIRILLTSMFSEMLSAERIIVITGSLDETFFPKLFSYTYPSPPHSPAGQSVFGVLCQLQVSLQEAYYTVEGSVNTLEDRTKYKDIYGEFRKPFKILLEWAKNLPSKQLYRIQREQVATAQASEGETGGGSALGITSGSGSAAALERRGDCSAPGPKTKASGRCLE